MCLNFEFLIQLTSPLEQFEINSCITSLVYTTTFPLEIIENFYENCSNYENKASLFSFWSILFILFFVKIIQLLIKQDGFIFLFIFLLVLLSCFNLFSFSNIIVNTATFLENDNNSFYYLNGVQYFQEDPTLNFWSQMRRLFSATEQFSEYSVFYTFLKNNEDNLSMAQNIWDFWLINNFLPNIVIHEEKLVGYSLFLGVLLHKFLKEGFFDKNLFNAVVEWQQNLFIINETYFSSYTDNPALDFPDWEAFYNTDSTSKAKLFFDTYLDDFLKFILFALTIDDLKNAYYFDLETADGSFPHWALFLILLSGIYLATDPELLALSSFYITENQSPEQVWDVYNNISLFFFDSDEIQNFMDYGIFRDSYELLYGYFMVNCEHVFPQLLWIAASHYVNLFDNISEIKGGANISSFFNNFINNEIFCYLGSESILLDNDSMEDRIENLLGYLPILYSFFDIENNFIQLTSNQNLGIEYITLNTSFINVYHIFFSFVFIFFIIYLLYNKSLSNNSNFIIPNLYQVIGENIYKVSLNLFYSVLGKHISHPEFFIKINTIFIFLIISNVQGMIPYMSTLTSALTNTFYIALALFISIIITLLDKKGWKYFLNLFMPSGCPILLVLLLIPIEIISYSFRVISLSVRLFANMMAGHTLLKVIVGFSWVIVFLGNTFLINLFPIAILIILTLLEFGVALIQAYIFTILSCIYLRDIFEGH